MERPLGIVLIAIMQVIGGGLLAILGLVMTAVPSSGIQVLGLGGFLLGVLGVASAYGLWTLQSWGRVLVLVFTIVSIPLSFVMPAAMGTTFGAVDLLFIGISVIVIVYLLQPSIADRFSVGAPSPGPSHADARPSYDVKKWNALMEIDPEIAAAVAQLEPYGSPAVAELATKFLTLNDKQYLGAMVKQVTERYSAQRAAPVEGRKSDEVGSNVQLVWRTPWGAIAKMRNGTALVLRLNRAEILRSLEEFHRRYPGDSEGWDEITDIEDKRKFYADASPLLREMGYDVDKVLNAR